MKGLKENIESSFLNLIDEIEITIDMSYVAVCSPDELIIKNKLDTLQTKINETENILCEIQQILDDNFSN